MSDFTPVSDLLGSLLPPRASGPAPPSQPVAPDALATGLPALDALTGGWRPGELVLVTGGPGTGKSALLYSQALHAARTRAGAVALLALKHTERVCLWRLAAPVAGVQIGRVLRGVLSADELRGMADAAAHVAGLPLHLLVPTDPVLEEVAEQVRRLHRLRGLALLVVDGLHALGLRAEETEPVTRERRLVETALGLRELAGELSVPVLASIASEPQAGNLAPLADRVLRIDPADPATGRTTLRLRTSSPGERAAEVRFAADRLRFEPLDG
jgi:replicative DNA helicase